MAKFIAEKTICILIVLISMNIFGAEYSQAQQMPVIGDSSYENNTVRILGIDPTAYPKIKVNVFVDRFSAVAGDLDKENFRVEEDGSEVAIDNFYFTGNASGQKLDLAVVFDNTNSMRPEIGAMKSKVKDLTDSIAAAGIDASYSLVSFGNDVSVRTAWTSDPAAFKIEVDALYVISGIDEPENPLDAIEAVLSMGFRPDSQKVILVITDDYAHHKDDGSSISNFTKEEVEADLNESGAMLVVVSPKFEGSSEYVDLREVAEDTDSLWIDIESGDFSAILEQFKGIVTGSYVIEYASPDPTPASTKTVSVSVIASEFAEYEAISSYIVPSNVTSPNDPPVIDELTADKTSPQQPGSAITWTVNAADPNGDQILYRFFLDDEPTTNWKVENSWTWTAPAEEGSYRIEAQVRDGAHAGPNGMDDRRAASFQIASPTTVEPDNRPPVVDDLVGAQNSATAINWTATAIDEDGDQILYKFYLNNRSMTEWSTDGTWTLNTAEAIVGENRVAVEIRDGKHSDPDGYDDTGFVQFELSSMKLIVQKGLINLGAGRQAVSVQLTSDGGYIVAGNGGPGAWLVKIDANGNKLWDRTVECPHANDVQQTNDGGYIFVGSKDSQGWFMKTDADGNKLWDKTFGELNLVYDQDNDFNLYYLFSGNQTSDGGYILAGMKKLPKYIKYGRTISADNDFWLIKTDENGNEVWSRTFASSPSQEWAHSVLQTNDGGYILAGNTGDSPGDFDSIEDLPTWRGTWLIKTDSLGYMEWDRILPGNGYNSVRQTNDGGYIVGGGAYSSLIKIDSMGNMEWDEFSNLYTLRDVQQTVDGGYVTTGFRSGLLGMDLLTADLNFDFTEFLIKIDSLGNEEWRKILIPNTEWVSIKQTHDSGYIIAGHNRTTALLLKTDSHGNF